MTLLCWSCGASLDKLTPPVGHRDQCPQCSNYLHVCKMCEFYDPSVARSCREDDADDVVHKNRVNFCDYFRPSAVAFDAGAKAAGDAAESAFNALFDDAADPAKGPDDSLSEAESLFSKD